MEPRTSIRRKALTTSSRTRVCSGLNGALNLNSRKISKAEEIALKTEVSQ